MTAKGFYFSPGSATLTATQKGSPLTVTPNVFNVTAADGVFSSDITICGIVFGSPQANVYLIGIDSNGVHTNQVLIDLIN